MLYTLHLETLVLRAYEHALAHSVEPQNVALTLCQTIEIKCGRRFVPGMPISCGPHVEPRIDTVL